MQSGLAHAAVPKGARVASKSAAASQERLGLETGVHRNYMRGIERAERRPTLTTIAVLARALGLRPSELIARAEEAAGTTPSQRRLP
jgi:transcriptional regulator with XRE-family HTH domain